MHMTFPLGQNVREGRWKHKTEARDPNGGDDRAARVTEDASRQQGIMTRIPNGSRQIDPFVVERLLLKSVRAQLAALLNFTLGGQLANARAMLPSLLFRAHRRKVRAATFDGNTSLHVVETRAVSVRPVVQGGKRPNALSLGLKILDHRSSHRRCQNHRQVGSIGQSRRPWAQLRKRGRSITAPSQESQICSLQPLSHNGPHSFAFASISHELSPSLLALNALVIARLQGICGKLQFKSI